MAEDVAATGAQPATKSRFRLLDVVISLIILAIIVILAVILFKQLHIKHEVSAATGVSDQILTDIRRGDAQTVYNLGDARFQKDNSVDQLRSDITALNQTATGTPTVVRRTLLHGTQTDSVSVIYKFGSKTPYYLRVITTDENGSWKLYSLTGNSSENPLLKV